MPKEKTKVCIGCFYPLPLSKFNKYNWGVDGVRARCKKCFAIHRKGGPARTAKRKELLAKGLRPCSGCKRSKPLSSFQEKTYANGNEGWEGQCKSCVSKSSKVKNANRNKDTRGFVFEYLKKHPCVDCGETNVLALEFDHIHSKKFDIGNALNSNKGMKLVKAEIKKCVVRCSSCHRIKTHIERDTWRFNLSLQDKATSRKIKNTKQYKTLMKAG
jgi:hypothetical protein